MLLVLFLKLQVMLNIGLTDSIIEACLDEQRTRRVVLNEGQGNSEFVIAFTATIEGLSL